jgi:hypothetical protein
MMGVDVARFGDDRTTIYFRRGKDARSIQADQAAARSIRCSSAAASPRSTAGTGPDVHLRR